MTLGRPPRHEGERLSKNRTFRVRGDLDECLQHAANMSGRSVSEEIEYRLQKSFWMDTKQGDGNEQEGQARRSRGHAADRE
jgi:hypothetical protein